MNLLLTIIHVLSKTVKTSLDDDFNVEYFACGSGLADVKGMFMNLFEDARNSNDDVPTSVVSAAKENLELIYYYYRLAKYAQILYKVSDEKSEYGSFNIKFAFLFCTVERFLRGNDTFDLFKNDIDDVIASISTRKQNDGKSLCLDAEIECYFLYNCCKLIVYKNLKIYRAKGLIKKIFKECKPLLFDRYSTDKDQINEYLHRNKRIQVFQYDFKKQAFKLFGLLSSLQ